MSATEPITVGEGGDALGRSAAQQFEGFDPKTVPSPSVDFSVKNKCVTDPDAIVDIKEAGLWVRIPISKVDLRINKDGPADITRYAKVEFPAEWGDHSIVQYVNGFQAQNQAETADPYDECRIFMQDQHDDVWQVVHYGYVGGVGPTSDAGVFKFWCYDPADLMKGIQVSKSFGSPTIATVLDFALNGTDDNGEPVGINNRSVFDDIQPYLAGIAEVKEQKQNQFDLPLEDRNLSSIEEGEVTVPIGPYQLNISDVVDDIFDTVSGSEVTQGLLSGQKHFEVNRHNMVDLMNWFSAEVGGKWHFEPTANGPILFYDNTSARAGTETPDGKMARRVFVEEEVFTGDDDPQEASDGVGPSGFTDKDVFSAVDTLNNNAIVDIKPFNSLTLYGATSTPNSRAGPFGGTYTSTGAPGAYTEQYPFVKLVYEPLLDRSGGYEYTAPAIESDSVHLEQAKEEAITEFRKYLSEETEGSVELKGDPHIVPYDYLRTIPTCDDRFPNAGANPITYEVNGVQHVVEGDERYTTNLGVSLVFAEKDLDIEAEFRKA